MLYYCKCDHEVYTITKEFPQYVSESLSGRLRELKNKGKDQLAIPKSGRGPLWERSLTRAFDYRVLVTIQTGFPNGGLY